MNVRQLIEKLQQLPQDVPVIGSCEHEALAGSVKEVHFCPVGYKSPTGYNDNNNEPYVAIEI